MSLNKQSFAIITSFPPGTGVGRYNEILHLAINDKAKWINININRTMIKNYDSLQEIEIKSKLGFLPEKISSKLNVLLQKKIFFKELISETINYKYLHYTDPRIVPLPGISGIVTIHDLTSIDNHNIFDIDSIVINKNINIYKKFENVIVNSNYVKSQVESYGFNGRIKTIHLAASPNFRIVDDKESIRKKIGLPIDKILILSISSNAPRKNLSIIKDLKHKLGGNIEIVRIGTPITNAINLHNVDDAMLNMLYNAVDLLLFPSLSEGFGYPVVEAFATGLPVVALDIPIMQEIISKYGLLADNNLDDIAIKIKECLNSQEEYKKLSLLRSEYFSFQRYEREVIQYYDDIFNYNFR